jgi:importin subunit beta-1
MLKSELDQALLFAQSSDPILRKKAEFYLKELENKNIEEFFIKLCNIFKQESYDNHIRRLAGLVLKNRLEIKEKNNKEGYSFKWLNFVDKNLRNNIKESIWNVFRSSSVFARRTASQIMAKIITIELSVEEQSNILLIFTDFIENGRLEISTYHSILETIEFVCQETGSYIFSENTFKNYSFQIIKLLLTAINEIEEKYDDVKIAALNGLLSIINFVENILRDKMYGDFIIKSVCFQMNSLNTSIRAVSFETMDKIAQNYYFWLDDYIFFLFNLTLFTIENDNDSVILQAIELWTTIANQEFEMNMEEYQALYEGRFFLSQSKNYILKASSSLSNLLLNCIHTKNNQESFEEWNCCNAAGACLNIMSQVSPKEIIHPVILFIDKNLSNNNFYINIESSTLAFISVFDGIGAKVLYSYARKMLLFWLINIADSTTVVYNIVSLTIGKISHNFPCIIRYFLDRIIQIFLINMAEKELFYNSYWCLNEFLQSFGKEGIIDWCFERIYSIVLKKNTFKSYKNKIANELFEIISSLIINSSIRNEPFIYAFLPYLLSNLYTNNINKEIQSYLCKILGCAIQKYGKKINSLFLDKIVDALSYITFNLQSNESEYYLEEEVLVCIGALVQTNKIKNSFNIKNWINFLFKSVENSEDNDISYLAIGVIGDICRTVEKEIKPFIGNIINILINKLQKSDTEKKIKPSIINCISDITLNHKFNLKKSSMLIETFKKIVNISQKTQFEEDSENFEINLRIKESILESITGIIQFYEDQDDYYLKIRFFEKSKWI